MENILSQPWFIPLVTGLLIIAVAPLAVAFTVLLERKVLADMQARLGPMRVGPQGLLQTIADAVKLLTKEDIIPTDSNRWLFRTAPVISFFTACTCLTVVPFSDTIKVTDVNVGLLVISAMSAVGILGIILGGWSSNSHYSLLGGLRSAAQLVSYEVALGLALISGVMCAGTLSMSGIVHAQAQHGVWFAFDNYGLMLIPTMVYLVSCVAETNRAPFDLPEAESELVAGFHTEFSGFRWGVYMLSEYVNMFAVGSVLVTLFWGGWLRPFPSVGWLAVPMNYGMPLVVFGGTGLACLYLSRRQPIRGYAVGIAALGVAFLGIAGLFMIPAVNVPSAPVFWWALKLFLVLYLFIWLRGTFPRYRYDQLMNIGWKVMIPTGLGAIFVNAVVGMARR
ncbi:MAG: NADH-quinone oxidoreductase subunit H [Candidatus Solibacter usitatus]|nr:NADH-quinone oxidoreductase subunit H [Candidatus Solibacter usitatus]